MTPNPNLLSISRCEKHDTPSCVLCNGTPVRLIDEYSQDGLKVGAHIIPYNPNKIMIEKPIQRLTPDKDKSKCEVDGCDDPGIERGKCHKHYIAWRKGNLPGFPPWTRIAPVWGAPKEMCSCGKHPIRSKGMCQNCYNLWYYHYKVKGRRREMEEQARYVVKIEDNLPIKERPDLISILKAEKKYYEDQIARIFKAIKALEGE